MKDIWAIILAAGESKRMGSPKMLLTFNGKTIIGTVIDNILRSGIKNIMVVLGSDNVKILKAIENLPVKHCYNADYRHGMLTSVKCGFKSLPEDFRAALVFPGDQPLIDPAVINSVTEAFISKKKGIVIPVCKGKRGHPLLLAHKYRNIVLKLGPGEYLNSVPGKFPSDVLEIKVNSRGILIDIDTKEDYIRELKQI